MKFKVITAAVVVFTSLPVAFSDEASSCGLRASHSSAREKSRGKCTARLTFMLCWIGLTIISYVHFTIYHSHQHGSWADEQITPLAPSKHL